MNYPIRYKLAILTACAALPATGLLAQAPATTSTPSVSVPAASETPAMTQPGQRGGKMREKLATLTPEERQKLKAAHKAALQDPAVKSAEATKETDKKGFHKVMRDAMLRADPSVGPILEKLREEGHGKNS